MKKQAATSAAIDAAELRMEESRRETREALRRVSVAFRETVARPSTIAAAAGVASIAGLAGFFLARRPRPTTRRRRVAYASGKGVVVASSIAAIGRLLLSRYGVRGLTLAVRQLRKSWAKRRARAMTNVPAPAYASPDSPAYASPDLQ